MIPSLGVLWFILCRHLSSEWSVNEQYNYGWFVPFFALILFWLRWETRPEPAGARSSELEAGRGQRSEVRDQREQFRIANNHRALIVAVIGIPALLLLLPLRLFEIGNPDWRPLGWIHAAAVAALTLLYISYVGGKPWLRHFLFPVAFFFVAVPWVTPVEAPIIQGLMRVIAAVATETVNLFGIPAQLQGNLIRVSTGLVGINEACSGVRSLQTSIMIGLLFGELKRFSVGRRVALVGGAIAIALVANLLRAIFLVWIAATKNVSEVDRWHNLAGYAIVALVFVGSLGVAALLSKKVESRKAKVEKAKQAELNNRHSSLVTPFPTFYFLLSTFLWLLFVELAAAGWYRAHERNLVASAGWTVRAPDSPTYQERKINEGVRQTLRFDKGREAVWKTNDRAGAATNFLFFFRWDPGGSSVVRARAHRPDICLPTAGWRQIADLGIKAYSVSNNLALPVQHITFKQDGSAAVAHTFFCLQEDKIHKDELRPDLQLEQGAQPDWSFRGRTRAVRSGVRNLGQQVLEIVIVPAQTTDPGTVEQEFAEMLRELVVENKVE